ncbi:MAG: FtsK/SpoIIIE domain-containing protein, partial [Leifsonia sp.]
MRLVVDFDGIRREIDVARAEAGVTLADIIVKASGSGVADDETVWVDDRRHAVGDLVSDVLVLEGSSLSREPAAPIGPMAGWSLTRSGGMQAGQILAVPERRALAVGRSPQADITLDSPSASWSHLTVERDGDGVRVRDAGSTNGTFVNGVQADADGILVELDAVVLAGGTALLLRQQLPETPAPRPGSLHNLTAAGTAPFNRPPRPGLLAKPPAVVPPTRKEVAPTSKFSIITVVGPLAIAAGMVVLLHNVAYAAVALLSPVLAVGTWFEQRRRRRKESAGEQSRFTQTLDTFRDDLRRAADVERRRRGDESPDPATMLRRACLPATTLWQRRHNSPDFLSLHAGVGDVPWEPEIDRHGGSRLDDDAQRVVDDSHIPASPVQVDLTGAGVVGIVGNRADALAVARSLLMQASIHCGPADLTVVVCCDQGREAEWEWTAWLPHTRRAAEGSADLWVSAQQSRSESLLRTLRDGIEQLPTPAVLLVLDTDVLLEGRDSAARALLGHGRPSGTIAPSQPLVQVSGIVVASSEEQLPASCTVVIHAGQDAEGTVSRPHDRAHVDDVILAGVDVPTARAGAIQLARFDDPELIVADARLPAVVRLNPLLGLDTVDAETILKRWASATGVATPIGMGERGQFSLDLVHDGPHGLVGGTTGSGKSEFLRSLVAGLAASNPPSKLTFILIDFKGGAAFATCERLPHTIGTVSNLDEQLADRALRALEAEMQYRQRVFAAAGEGIDNLDAYLATNPREPMPRLLLVVDEFAMLAKDYPDVLSSLVSVAAVGRTLGVHMILATQRPAGVVNDDILANTNLRVALRVQSREDSTNVIGVANASAIGRGQWGRAFIKLGQDDITPVQTALSTGPLADAVAEPLEVHPVVFGRPTAPAKPTAAASASSQTDLDVLIDAIAAASDQAGFVPPRPV